MEQLSHQLEVTGIPVHVESWSVARIPGFVLAVLNRWQREYGRLPSRFHMAMCPQVEINARGGIPPQVHGLTDPRLTCRHFTGCHKPYFVVIFSGEDSAQRCQAAQDLLSWSEGYEVEIAPESVRLRFEGYTEDAEDTGTGQRTTRTLQDLLKSGEIVKVLE